MYDVAIIGAGITGCSIAYELGKYNVKAVIIEKENDVSVGTTKANSAIIHGGYDPKPGTQMAKYNVKGNVYTKELCEKLDVPYKQIGALVVAFSEEEKKTLEELKQRGITNGVPDMEIWDKEKLLKEEPNLSDKAVAALSSPNVGIVSPWELALALAETAVLNGVEVKLNTKVSGIEKENDTYKIETNNGVIEAKYICNAAGVFAEAITQLKGITILTGWISNLTGAALIAVVMLSLIVFGTALLTGSGNAPWFAFGPLTPGIGEALGTQTAAFAVPMHLAGGIGRCISPFCGGVIAISGVAESYWGKNKGRSMEGNLEKFTKIAAILIFVLALVLNLKVI